MPRKPDFIIIGAMKSATTSLHDQLAAHAGVHMSVPKEPNFFSDEDQWGRGLDWYWDLFAKAPSSDLCGESSTHYTKLPRHHNVVDRIAEHVPDAKFIYVMRHPVDRLVSHYIHEWTQRVIDEPIQQAIDSHPNLVDFGLYAMQLRPWVERFGRERILPVFFDRLRAHPQAELERVCHFIAYEGTPRWREIGPSNISADRMRHSPLRDYVVNLPIVTAIRRRFIPQWVRDRIKHLWMLKRRPSLDDADRRRLVERFDPDLAELGRALGIELSCDNFVAQTRDEPREWVEAPFAAASGRS
jgi:aryl carrier-like protein